MPIAASLLLDHVGSHNIIIIIRDGHEVRRGKARRVEREASETGA